MKRWKKVTLGTVAVALIALAVFVVPTVYTYLARKRPTLAHLQETGEDTDADAAPSPAG